jgi:hypothetical protein
MKRNARELARLLLMVAAAAPGLAFAQETPSAPMPQQAPGAPTDEAPAHEAGKGFYRGGYQLIPTFALESFYDSNVFRTSRLDSEVATTALTGAAVIRAGAALQGQRAGAESRSTLGFGVGLGYNQFISGDGAVRNLSDLDATANIRYQYQPQGRFSYLIQDDFQRSITPRTIRVSPGSLVPTFREDTNRFIFGVRLKPGGGALEQQIAYTGSLHVFEGNEFITANHFEHDLGTYTKWNFLPRTAALFEAHLGVSDFFQDFEKNPLGSVDSRPLRVSLGALGIIGARIQFKTSVGYGNSFHKRTGDPANEVSFSGVIGEANMRVNLADRDILAVGYSHNFATTLFGNFVTRDSVSASLIHSFSPRMQASGDFSASFDRYSNIPALDGQIPVNPDLPRRDIPITLGIKGEYLLRPDLKVGGSFSMISYNSNFQTQDDINNGINDAGYFSVRFGLQAAYTY